MAKIKVNQDTPVSHLSYDEIDNMFDTLEACGDIPSHTLDYVETLKEFFEEHEYLTAKQAIALQEIYDQFKDNLA